MVELICISMRLTVRVNFSMHLKVFRRVKLTQGDIVRVSISKLQQSVSFNCYYFSLLASLFSIRTVSREADVDILRTVIKTRETKLNSQKKIIEFGIKVPFLSELFL